MNNIKNFYLPLARVHITEAYRWGQAVGTDYWFTVNPGFDIFAAAATTVGEQLAENGWVATSLVNTAGSAADFGSITDPGIPNHALTDASADLLSSPAIFGDFAHMEQAGRLVGKGLPNYLVLETLCDFTIVSANEPRTCIGFIVAGGSPATEANQQACISTDSTNWQIGANSVYVAGSAVGGAAWIAFKIVLDRAQNVAHWYIRNMTTGTWVQQPDSGQLPTDVYPLKFGFHSLTTNRIAVANAHIFYDW